MSRAPANLRQALEAAAALHRAGNITAAAARYRAILADHTDQPDGLHLLGLIHHQQGDHATAADFVEQARLQRPGNVDIATNLSRIYLALEAWQKAAEISRAALALAPNSAAGHCNLGIALIRLGDPSAGEAEIRRCLAQDENNAAAWSALGLALHAQAKTEDAGVAWERALALDPSLPEARFNLAAHRLTQMDFARGWPLFDARAQIDRASFGSGGQMPVEAPRWRGEDIRAKTILIWGEQGLGDQILFAGLVPDLCARAGRVVFACAPRLATLFARSFAAVAIVSQDDSAAAALAQEHIDLWAPLGTLGQFLRPTAAAFHAHDGYLTAEPGRVAAFETRARAWPGRRIGLSWHSQRATTGAAKSIPLVGWAPVLAIPGASFVSLQYGEVDADLAAAGAHGVPIHRDPSVDATHDLEALAAQIASLDLVISVSNTTAHLAGALGVPVWTLAPVGAGQLWYWFAPAPRARSSPWYPAMRVYHQQRPGVWDDALSAVAVDLSVYDPRR